MLEQIGPTARVRLRAERTRVHSNLAPCILFGRERTLSVESENGTFWGDAILVGANWEHAVNFHGGAVDVIYIESNLVSREGVVALPKAAQRILADQVDCWSMDSAAQLLDSLGHIEKPCDHAISTILARIACDPMVRLSETEAGQISQLERSTMLRRFKRYTGMTFRSYKSWAALKHASRLIGKGEALGIAGLDAGFSDAAHFSRRYRAIFGLSPTEGRNCLI